MKQAKKKASFDIDPEILSDVKNLCQSRNMKVADFYRAAVEEKLKRDREYITIYIPVAGKIEKATIEQKIYDIDIFEASEKMKENVGAVNEGVLRFKSNEELSEMFEDLSKEDQEARIYHPVIFELLQDLGKVAFFTKQKYV